MIKKKLKIGTSNKQQRIKKNYLSNNNIVMAITKKKKYIYIYIYNNNNNNK